MDLNFLLHRHQHSLMHSERSLTPRDKRVHEQFARGYAEQIQILRAALGARPASEGAVT
jgi:hypothetical protein